jgi:hypothetical protein
MSKSKAVSEDDVRYIYIYIHIYIYIYVSYVRIICILYVYMYVHAFIYVNMYMEYTYTYTSMYRSGLMALLNLYSLTYTVSEDEMKAEVSTTHTLSAPVSGITNDLSI